MKNRILENQPRLELPHVGVITNSSHDVGQIADRYLPLAGKTVLCIGLSEAEIDTHIAPFGPASITSLTLWADHIDAGTTRYRLVVGDITKETEFHDNTFDAIVTLSVFEHLDPLKDGLVEMRRITRRGGIIASLFGPVWSCAYGHHLYAIDPQDPLLNFSLWQMPAFMHLLWDNDQIRDFYSSKGFSDETIREVIRIMFEWKGINRLMMVEYMRFFIELFQIEYVEMMYNDIQPDILEVLRKKYPENTDFQTYGAKIVLRNNLK